MEIVIPSWAVWVIGTFGGGFIVWMVFLTKMAFQSKEDATANKLQDIHIMDKIAQLDSKMDDTKNDINHRLDKLEHELIESVKEIRRSIDSLFGSEMSIMRNLLHQQNKP